MMLCNYLALERVSKTSAGGDLQVGSVGMSPNGLQSLAFASYVGNDPVNATDPSGMCRVEVNNLWDEFHAYTGEYLKTVVGPVHSSNRVDCDPTTTPGSGGGGAAGGGGGGNGEGGDSPSQPPCGAPPGTRFADRETAGLNAVQFLREAQRKAGDNNERSFSIFAVSGGFTFGNIRVGSPGNVNITVSYSGGGGHLHTIGGGNTLSRGSDLSRPGYRADVERIRSAMDQFGRAGHDVSRIITILGAENGQVRAWYGRNLSGRGRVIGTDGCSR
jgi:hypothetical protein